MFNVSRENHREGLVMGLVSGWRASAHVIIYCVYVSGNTWTANRPLADRPTPPVGIVKTLRASLPLNEDIASV